jgi:hypothetical protein
MDAEAQPYPERPCPFCGATKLIATQVELEDGTSGPYAIECGCGASGPRSDTLRQAVTLWDRRPRLVRA